MSPQREAKLKPEFAEIYPGLQAGIWYPAARVAEYFLARLAQVPSATTELADRVLDERHFEFRGGPPAEAERDGTSRASDQRDGQVSDRRAGPA
jgi:hypothetical protein